MMDRQKKLNDLIWLLIYQGNASLFCLYTSLTENTVEGTAQKNRTDIRSCSMIFDRLYFFTKTICNPASPHFEECFAFVLEKASTSDVVQRVMLLMCVMKESALAYRPPQYTVEEHLSDPIAVVSSASSGPEALEGALYTVSIPHSNEVLRFLSDFFLALPTTPPVRQAVLRAFHHPGKCNPPCLPTTDGKSDQPVVNWVEEIAWFEAQDRESRHIVIDLPTINLLFTSELSFLYCVMSQLFISKRDDDGSAAEDFAAIKDIFTKYLLPEDLGLAFEAPVDGEVITARHFVRLLLSTDLSMSESIELMQSMIAAGRVNKAVFTMIVEDGLLTCSYATLLQLVCATFFDQGDYTRMEFLPNSVQHIPDFPVIILQELWKHRGATVMGDSEFLPRLLSIVLRAEGYSQRGVEVATLSKEVKNTKFDADQIKLLVEELHIAEYLSERCRHFIEKNPENDYVQGPLESFVFGLIVATVVTKSREFIVFVELFPTFFDTFFVKGTGLRGSTITYIARNFTLRPEIKGKMESNCILNEGRHFHADALDLMTLTSGRIEHSVVCGLIVMALKLEDYKEMKRRVEALISNLEVAYDSKAPVLKKILKRIEELSSNKLACLSIENVESCVNNAVTALALLNTSGSGVERRRLNGLFDHFLSNENASSWPALFKSSHSIATFIKYLTREDFSRAYDQFKALNVNNTSFLDLLTRVESLHSQPIVRDQEMEKVVAEGTSTKVVDDVLELILGRCSSTGDQHKAFIGEVSVAWMRVMFAKLTIPMAPKNVQIITAAACALWLSGRAPGFSSLIAQVGTGEGKSLIIAMLASFCVKILKKKVHILENNVSLLDKDYTSFCCKIDKNGVSTNSFYGTLGVTASKNIHEEADVTYCLRADIETYYRDGVFSGTRPFKNTVLIVDEVDELIVEKIPNTQYVKSVTNCGGPLKEMFDLLRDTNGKGVPADCSKQLWKEASAAYAQAKRVQKDVDYKCYGGSKMYFVKNGEVEKNVYQLWLEYLRYQADKSYEPRLNTIFFYQNITHMMTQYDAIVGLSGSLGCSSEQAFLRDTYNASCFEVPSFLDTCKNVRKHKPELIDAAVEVHTNEFDHSNAIIDMALRKYLTVPVLIVTKSPDAAKLLVDKITARLNSPAYSGNLGDFNAKHFVQLFLKIDEHGQDMKWHTIIDAATAVISSGLPRRITVTDGFGGRGHDFSVNDEKADTNGGLTMIATLMPDSERDWTQWLGRTARNDRRGQYAVILRSDEILSKDSPATNIEQILSQHADSETGKYRPALIGDLLKLRDAQSKVKIDTMQQQVRLGQQLNELCDHFYSMYNNKATGEWPGIPENEKLSLFLDDNAQHTKEGIKKFAQSLGVNYTSKY